MKRLVIIVVVLIFCARGSPGFSQFTGGNGDGGSTSIKVLSPINTQQGYCTGGANDGYAKNNSGLFTLNSQSSYCSGGNGDGYDTETGTGDFTNEPLFCSGGNGDGHSGSLNPIHSLNQQQAYCTGGIADGHSTGHLSLQALNPQEPYCNGGENDGHHVASFSGLIQGFALSWNGGNGDGYGMSLSLIQPLNAQEVYCTGGDNDGHSAVLLSPYHLGTGLWMGTVNTLWTEADNWTNSIVPDYQVPVVIPSGCHFYPELTGTLAVNNNSVSCSYACKSLFIRDGGLVSNTGNLSLYGEMTVAGKYTANSNTNNGQNVYSGGSLNVPYPGIVLFGNQSSGYGYCDLNILNGGILNVYGGILEVDDQLKITYGGTLMVSSGTVFAHKYGIGSPYSGTSSGSFVIDYGVNGSVTGGIIKVNGKASSGSLYAVKISSPSFYFDSGGTLEITDGVYASGDDTEIRTVSGSTFGKLVVNKPYRNVILGSDAVFLDDIEIEHNASLIIGSSINVTVDGDVILK